VYADDFLSLSKAFHYPIQCTIINFLFASLKSARINLSQAASGVTESQAASFISIFLCKNHRLRVFEAGYWEGVSKLVRNFKGTS
jgi:hypothetical protein